MLMLNTRLSQQKASSIKKQGVQNFNKILSIYRDTLFNADTWSGNMQQNADFV